MGGTFQKSCLVLSRSYVALALAERRKLDEAEAWSSATMWN